MSTSWRNGNSITITSWLPVCMVCAFAVSSRSFHDVTSPIVRSPNIFSIFISQSVDGLCTPTNTMNQYKLCAN